MIRYDLYVSRSSRTAHKESSGITRLFER